MGYYDDEGNYHKDTYDDDDDISLKDIGDFCEKAYYGEDERPMTQQEKDAYEVPNTNSDDIGIKTISSAVGAIIGGIVGLFMMKAGGTILILLALVLTGGVIGELYHIIKFEEVAMSAKEIMAFLCKKLKLPALMILMELASHIN